MDTYPQSNDSSDHEFLLAELKYINCLNSVQIFKCFHWDVFKTAFGEKYINVRVI